MISKILLSSKYRETPDAFIRRASMNNTEMQSNIKSKKNHELYLIPCVVEKPSGNWKSNIAVMAGEHLALR